MRRREQDRGSAWPGSEWTGFWDTLGPQTRIVQQKGIGQSLSALRSIPKPSPDGFWLPEALTPKTVFLRGPQPWAPGSPPPASQPRGGWIPTPAMVPESPVFCSWLIICPTSCVPECFHFKFFCPNYKSGFHSSVDSDTITSPILFEHSMDE